MVDFRRVITALAVLALFTGMAVAQVGGSGQSQLTCNTNVTVTPQLRGEGFTEETGDITISCTGGAAIPVGGNVPLVNFSIFYNTVVTSRLIPISGASNVSEALLLIDEPGSGLPGPGPSLPQMLCTSPLTGCAAQSGFSNTTVNPGTTTPAPNVYQGVVNGNSVTFFGVPVNPPTTTGQRVFRITNVRVNANPLAGGSASGASPVQASISISGSTSLSIQNSSPNVGFVSNGLTATASSAANLNQCSTASKQAINTLTFTENFGTAFKTRVQAQSNTTYAGQALPAGTVSNPYQNIPGAIYNSESNFVFAVPGGTAGLADFGTRLKATFNNIPSGARIFVSTSNVLNGATPAPVPAVIGGSTANTGVAPYVGYAQLINGENTSDGNAGTSGFFPAVTPTDNAPGSSGTVPIAEVTLTGGTGTAVWEAVNTNPNTIESFKFAVFISYTANVAQNSPAAGSSTVNLSFAPTATSGVASSTASIPRFTGDTAAARPISTISICRTILLYPYVTNQAGFDTGLEIANTSQDSFTLGSNATGAQAGSCTLTWYSAVTPAPPASNTGNIAAGTIWVNTVGILVPNFQGYMFAVCNFQYAHGFAFISDVGARNLAMGYLAIVIPDPGTGARVASPACQGIGGCSPTGENDAH